MYHEIFILLHLCQITCTSQPFFPSAHCYFWFYLFIIMGILLIFLPDIIRVVTENFQINICLMPSLCINTHPSIFLHLYHPLPPSCSFPILAVLSFSISLTFTFPFSLYSPSPLQVHVCPDAKPCPGEHQYHRYSWNPVWGETEDKQRSA